MAMMPESDRLKYEKEKKTELNKIRQVESSGGRPNQLIGERITRKSDPNYGAKAAGSAQLMPNTMYELLKEHPINKETSDPLLQKVAALQNLMRIGKDRRGNDSVQNPDDITNTVASDPAVDKYLQNEFMTRQYNQENGDPRKIAYSWKQGMNIDPNNLTPNVLAHGRGAGYVQKVMAATPTPQESPVYADVQPRRSPQSIAETPTHDFKSAWDSYENRAYPKAEIPVEVKIEGQNVPN